MRTRYTLVVAMAFGAIATVPWSGPVPARSAEHEASVSAIEIPGSVRAEHMEIHAMLERATKAPGRVGVAARALARVLQPHFEREEQIALPPLGLLAPLAAGDRVPDAEATAVLAMSDSLRTELPGMLEEHQRIRAAVADLRRAAVAAHDARDQRLADALTLHARTEEEVFYPAAILAGDVIRSRQATH